MELHPALHGRPGLRVRVRLRLPLRAHDLPPYEQEGDAIVEPYLELLRAGGSQSPEELARIVGLDLTDPAIWAAGIDALAEEVDEAERLAAEIGLG